MLQTYWLLYQIVIYQFPTNKLLPPPSYPFSLRFFFFFFFLIPPDVGTFIIPPLLKGNLKGLCQNCYIKHSRLIPTFD